MTLDQVFQIIDQLTPEQKQQVSQYIEKQQQDALYGEIQAILKNTAPSQLQSGTMKPDKLMQAIEDMWSGLPDEEIDEIVQAMNEEYIEPDVLSHDE